MAAQQGSARLSKASGLPGFRARNRGPSSIGASGPHDVDNVSAKIPVVLESERAAIGSGLRDPETAEMLVSELQQEDFYSGRNQKVLRTIRDLSDEGLTINPVSVAERTGLPRSEIDELYDAGSGVSASQLRTLISDIRRVGRLRGVYNACTSALCQLGRDSKIEDVVSVIERGIYNAGGEASDEAKDGSDTVRKVVDDFLVRQLQGGGPEISTGLRDLDRALVGLRPGKMGVIAARPSMGKTALAGTIRRSVLQQGYGVIEFALEMSAEELIERELAFQASLNLRKILSAKEVSEDELNRVRGVPDSIKQVHGRWYVVDNTYSISGIRRKARVLSGRMARSGVKVGLVVIDYLQLAGEPSGGEGAQREQSIASVSRGAKFLAKELGCTVLALSQLNRSCEYRDDRRPMMSDLRESGSIEQDADWIGFVYREHVYDHAFPAEEAEFIIRKQRSGPIGTVHLRYSPKTCTFGDREHVPEAAEPREVMDGP